MPELDPQKHEELFAGAVIQAWVSSKVELDKTYIGLSAGGIGLIVTLLTRENGVHNLAEFLLFISGVVFFCLAILSGILIFNYNPKELEAVLQGKNGQNPFLSFLDHAIRIFFLIAVFLTLLAGISSSWESFHQNKGVCMADKNMGNQGGGNRGPSQSVFDSFNGISALRPQAQNTTQQTSGQSQGTPTSPTTPTNSGK